MKIVRATNEYTRADVEKDVRTLYVFTDNVDRSSGKNPISHNSWYYKKYSNGKELYYPTVTTAILRGLDNAFPISTQHWYNSTHRGVNGRWTDSEFCDFKAVIDAEFCDIKEHAHEYDRIVFPIGGIFNRKISAISLGRTPKLYKYLMDKCKELFDI